MPDEKADISPTPDAKLILQTRKMELDAEARKLALEAEIKKMEREVGLIGKVLGSEANAPYNLACLTLLLTFIAGFVFMAAFPNDRLEFWKLIILPTITFVFGFVSGRSRNSQGEHEGS
jgi:hypothetical protein